MKFFKLLLPLTFLCQAALAHGESEFGNQRVSAYMHPVSLLASLAPKVPFALYLTGEYPISGFNSAIINPSLWAGSAGGIELFKIGTGIGMRHFANGNADGFYLQLEGSANYMSMKERESNASEEESANSGSGSYFDILGYIGYSAKYIGMSVFADCGAGYAFSNVKRVRDGNWIIRLSNYMTRDFAVEVNVGVGIPF